MIAPGVEAILSEAGPFVGEYYAAGADGINYLQSAKILVIGAGGLGCELLKSLALNGFKNIDVIDMDTIDVSNLNRQFLFRAKDVGRFKAEVAAEYIRNRIPGVNVTSHCCRIQELPDDFYKQFFVVIGGLDNIQARYWMSAKLVEFARVSNNEIMIPYIDGGTEAWLGHVKVILPNQGACMECQKNLFAPPETFQQCTVASKPRKPEHCIVWAKDDAWNSERKGEKVDGDVDEHIEWIMKKATEHAIKFNIKDEITFKFTRNVVKNTVAAIASTQAIIASMCTTETLKYITQAAPCVDNNVNFIGSSDYNGVNMSTFVAARQKHCPECGRKLNKVKFVDNELVEQFIKRLESDYNFKDTKTILLPNNESIINSLFPDLNKNLKKEIASFVGVGSQIVAINKVHEEFEILLES